VIAKMFMRSIDRGMVDAEVGNKANDEVLKLSVVAAKDCMVK